MAEQLSARDMVMVPDLGAAHVAEKFLCPIRASAIIATGFFIVDEMNLETVVQLIPGTGFVSIDRGAIDNAAADEVARMAFTVGHGGAWSELPSRSRTTTTTLRLPF